MYIKKPYAFHKNLKALSNLGLARVTVQLLTTGNRKLTELKKKQKQTWL